MLFDKLLNLKKVCVTPNAELIFPKPVMVIEKSSLKKKSKPDEE
jgi:hypothetical protein